MVNSELLLEVRFAGFHRRPTYVPTQFGTRPLIAVKTDNPNSREAELVRGKGRTRVHSTCLQTTLTLLRRCFAGCSPLYWWKTTA